MSSLLCPLHATYNPTTGRCHCDDGYFRVKGTTDCMPKTRLRVPKLLSTTTTLAPPSKEMDNLLLIEYLWIGFSITIIVALVVAGIYCIVRSQRGFSRLSEKRQEEKV